MIKLFHVAVVLAVALLLNLGSVESRLSGRLIADVNYEVDDILSNEAAKAKAISTQLALVELSLNFRDISDPTSEQLQCTYQPCDLKEEEQVQVLDGNGRFLGKCRTFSTSSCPDEFVMDHETSGRLLDRTRSFNEEFHPNRTYCLISNQAPLDNDENSDILTDGEATTELETAKAKSISTQLALVEMTLNFRDISDPTSEQLQCTYQPCDLKEEEGQVQVLDGNGRFLAR
jgi:hypothetical protein